MGTRINIFYLTHKALRGLLFETALRIQQNDFTNEHITGQLLDDLDKAVDLCLTHTRSELEVLKLPEQCAEEYDLQGKTEKTQKISHDLLNAVATYQYVNNSRSRSKTGNRINQLLSLFIAAQLQLMYDEETCLNELFVSFSDEQLVSIGQAMEKQFGSEKKNLLQRSIARAVNDEELIEWIHSTKEISSPASYEQMMTIASRELQPDRWNRICKQMDSRY